MNELALDIHLINNAIAPAIVIVPQSVLLDIHLINNAIAPAALKAKATHCWIST